nr:hypothetical protein [Tanacetum cinerariifolium]
TTAIAGIPISAAETIVTTVPTIIAEAKKTSVEVPHVPKAKRITIQEPEKTTTTRTPSAQQPQAKSEDKGKANMIEEPDLPKKKVQERLDKEYARRLQAEMQAEINEEERIASEKALKAQEKTNAALINTWEDIHARIDADAQLAQQLTEQEQQEMTYTEKAKLTELVEGSSKKDEVLKVSSKRSREVFEQKRAKKQKMKEDKESAKLRQCLKIVPDDGDDVTIDATPLSSNKMIKNFNIEDLKVLWRLVKKRFEKTQPVDYMDNFLLHTLKTMFEHHVEDNSILIFLLVEKMYPLTHHTPHQMFNYVRLQVDYECEMAFELLRLVRRQLMEGYVPT